LFNGTVHTSNKLSNLLLNLCPRMLLEPFTLDTSWATSSATCVRVLSLWPHVRQLVAELVRRHVASVKALLVRAACKYVQLKDLPSPYGDCNDTDGYVQSKCFTDCIARYIIKNCSCKDIYMPGQNNVYYEQSFSSHCWRHVALVVVLWRPALSSSASSSSASVTALRWEPVNVHV